MYKLPRNLNMMSLNVIRYLRNEANRHIFHTYFENDFLFHCRLDLLPTLHFLNGANNTLLRFEKREYQPEWPPNDLET